MATPPEQLSERPRKFNWWWVIAPVLLVVAVALLLPAIQGSRGGRRAPCINNLKQIGLALHNYHHKYGGFPPAYIAGKDGRPMHSWRVLLLPYLEQQELYEQYHFDEPWDSRHNLTLAERIPSCYRCPKDLRAAKSETSYLMLVGPGASSDGPHCRKIEEITDGTSNTIMVAERSLSRIHWMEPRDLDVEKMSYTINDPAGYGIRSPHAGVANALFADGTVHSISEKIDPEILKAVITINAGDRGSEFHTMNWP